MAADKFPRRDVERAFRAFKDGYQDVVNSVPSVWEDAFRRLIHHCEGNPVMRVVTEPLRGNKRVELAKWLAQLETLKGFTSSYRLPDDEEDRTALLYQFFNWLCEREDLYNDVFQFCMKAYRKGNRLEVVSAFNSELVHKFARVVSYRLDEILNDIGEDKEVMREVMNVFHHYDNSHHDHSMNIHGNVQGSNVAGPGATISGSTATYETNTDVADALKAMKSLIGDVASEQRQAVEGALDTLIDATRRDIPVAKVADAAVTVAKNAPTMGERLKDIAGRIGLSLVGSSIFLGIRMALGLH